MRKHLVLLVFLPLMAMAQSEEVGFIADRPGAINGVEVQPKGRVQLNTGAGYQHISMEGIKTYTWTLNTSVLEFGISDCAELRLQGDWGIVGGDLFDYNGPENVAIGTKVRLFDGWRFVPAVSMLGNVFIPSKHYDFMPDNWSGQMSLIFQNQLTQWLSLNYEGSLMWFDSGRPIFFYGASLCFTLSDRWYVLVDEYNYDYEDSTENWAELSAAYQLSKRVQFDVSTDINLNDPLSYWSLSVGVSWQITKK